MTKEPAAAGNSNGRRLFQPESKARFAGNLRRHVES